MDDESTQKVPGEVNQSLSYLEKIEFDEEFSLCDLFYRWWNIGVEIYGQEHLLEYVSKRWRMMSFGASVTLGCVLEQNIVLVGVI